MAARVSVLMPVFNARDFVSRALSALFAAGMSDWQLILVDDGSTDGGLDGLERWLRDPRVCVVRLERNVGLGAALNVAMEHATAPYIAYLPADDMIYSDHLGALADTLDTNPTATLAFSGVRHHYNRTSHGPIEGHGLQLVQVMHRRTHHRWLERTELVTDDLERMLWAGLAPEAERVSSNLVSCEWVDHPAQRHKIIREPEGGINPYRSHYGVMHPLRFHSTAGHFIDEVTQYETFRSRSSTPQAPNALRILLVGELAYNADRVLALEERGHELFGLWMPDPYWYNTVGPVPFGHVQDIAREHWLEEVRRIKPDVIYGLLNWQAVPFVHSVMQANPGIPFVWHFKEGPFICLEKGTWPELVQLYRHSNGAIFSSPEMRDWFAVTQPDTVDGRRTMVLDGDLPKGDWLTDERSPLLSRADGEVHTVVPGRPIGLHPWVVGNLADHGIHLHFYGDFTQHMWRSWIDKALALAPKHLHLHPNMDQRNWVREFSRYDAGWLHTFRSENAGDIRRANWDDLNYPARIATLMTAGLPMIQHDNSGSLVASQTLARSLDVSVFYSEIEDLAEQLRDQKRLADLRRNAWRQRSEFTFDHHADNLIAFFRAVIEGREEPIPPVSSRSGCSTA